MSEQARLIDESFVTGPDVDESASAEAVRAQLFEFYRSSRWVAPCGNFLGSAIFAAISWSHLPHVLLEMWLGASLLVSIVLAASVSFKYFSRRLDPYGLPMMCAVGHAMCGAIWGVTPWLGPAEPKTEYLVLCLALMFAVSAGTLTGAWGLSQLSMAVLVPMWLLGALGFALKGEYLFAIGSVCFLAIVGRDNASTARVLIELVRLREGTRAQAERAEWEASHDPLTGLPNRAGLLALAEEARRNTDHSAQSTTAMFIDLDHFKEVNDRFGHLAGDALLAQAAHRLRSTVRPDDVVGRLGGDEFLVLIFREIAPAATAKLAERIISTLEEPFHLVNDDVYVSASVGITHVNRHDADVHRLVHESDKALAQAKRNGRRQAVVFDSGLKAQLTERSGLELALRKAIREKQIDAWGQPVIEMTTGRVAWVEFLARWEANPGGFVPPSVFIPLAEEIGVVGDIGRQMLGHASAALQRWRDHPVLKGADAAVNISALHIVREDLVADVSQLMACEALPAQHLIIELTESHRLTDIDRVAATFRRLGAAGVRLAVDDFGTGYSSLGQLLALPVSIVKVDHSLTSGCDLDEDRAGVVRAIRQLAASLGHVVVAEGIETVRECEVMASIGIDQAQGYLFCPPLPLRELEDELIRHQGSWPSFGHLRQPNNV